MAAYDTLAKDVLELLLDELGTFVREREVPAPASRAPGPKQVADGVHVGAEVHTRSSL